MKVIRILGNFGKIWRPLKYQSLIIGLKNTAESRGHRCRVLCKYPHWIGKQSFCYQLCVPFFLFPIFTWGDPCKYSFDEVYAVHCTSVVVIPRVACRWKRKGVRRCHLVKERRFNLTSFQWVIWGFHKNLKFWNCLFYLFRSGETVDAVKTCLFNFASKLHFKRNLYYVICKVD